MPITLENTDRTADSGSDGFQLTLCFQNEATIPRRTGALRVGVC
jgi:hypothetical protein